ncbi:hypothetical protein DRJ48_02685 [Candidatus Woesearchaeota archaeon]|nr:hypothetical protein [Candidatus Woesearchaeota archaeon]RLE42822.1 MAG: hypothetical protein DRJ48_02685 [Candidatus Woesearchaeota archaeon]
MRTRPLLVLLLILLVVGCQQGKGPTTEKSPYIGGTNGLLISFMDNFPPAEVFDGGEDPFDIVVNLKNDGEFDIPAGEIRVSISGIQATEFNKNPGDMIKVLNQGLEGKKKDSEGNLIPGDEESVEFENFNHVSPLTGTMQYPVRADVCYLYGGIATTKLCFRKNLRSTEEGVCEVQGEKRVFNSGEPIQVQDFSEFVKGSQEIGFNFKIVKLGNGEVYKYTVRDCSEASYGDKNWVYVEIRTNEPGLECRGLKDGTATSGFVRLSDGEATVNCEQPANVQTDFEKPINIYLKYRYREDITTTLIVKHTPE